MAKTQTGPGPWATASPDLLAMEKAAAAEQAGGFVAPAQNETLAKQTVDAMLVTEAER